MEALKKADKAFKWIILSLAIAHIISYFMPIFASVYRDGEPNLIYWYGGSDSYYITISFTSLIIPIIALVISMAFLFANSKNSRLFFLGFSFTYIVNSIFIILNLSKSITSNSSDNYKYTFKYGYYFHIVTMALLAVVIICSFIIYLIIRQKNSKVESEESQQLSQSSKIDVLRKRIDLLDDLKKQGILTEVEYEQKRADIIKELKI